MRDYSAPAMPAERALRRLWRLAGMRLKLQARESVGSEHGWQHPDAALLDALARPPAYAALFASIDGVAQGWQEQERGAGVRWLRLVVLPPCDNDDLLGTWAKARSHAVWSPPSRASLCEAAAATALGDAQTLFVIPRLERWFLRRRDGLAAVRSLLETLGRIERPCLVGCNSWAWPFLARAAGATLALPSPLSPAPLDGPELRAWLGTLSSGGGGSAQATVFRSASSGVQLLGAEGESRKDAQECEQVDRFLRHLAALSLGIPWVAWHLWRESLRIATDPDVLPPKARKAARDERRTLWAVDPPEFALPNHHEQPSLLVLQALLMHGGLTEPELQSVLPAIEEPGVVGALQSAGFIERHADGNLRVRPAAYPAARTALQADGHPVGDF